MPRQVKQQIVDQRVINAISNPERLQVVAAPVDLGGANRSYADLANELAAVNPKLSELARLNAEEDHAAGSTDRQAGLEPKQTSNPRYMEGYNKLEGYLKTKDDIAEFKTQLDAADKTAPDWSLDSFSNKFWEPKKAAITNPAILKGWQATIQEEMLKIRAGYRDELQAEVEAKQHAMAQTWLTDRLKQFTNLNQPIPPEALDDARLGLAKTFGQSGKAYNQMVFNVLSEVANTSDPKVWDVTKQKRPDGTPGMYFIPEYTQKIDAAKSHAESAYIARQNALETAAKKHREETLDKSLLSIFMLDDPKQKQDAFEAFSKSGNFDHASDLLKWRKAVEDDVDRKASPDQLDNEVALLTNIYQGKVRPQQIIDADVTRSQRKSLLGELSRVTHDNRSLALQGAQLDKKIFQSPEYAQGMQTIDGQLASTASPMDPFGTGSEFNRQQKAEAKKEFMLSARGISEKKLSEVEARQELMKSQREITDRYLRHRKEVTDKSHPYAGRIRYTTSEELKTHSNSLSNEELKLHLQFLKDQKQPKPTPGKTNGK